MRRLPGFLFVLFLISCSTHVADHTPSLPDTSGIFSDREAGIKVSLKENWNLYTGSNIAGSKYEEQFTRLQTKVFKPLFIGELDNQRAFMRLFSEEVEIDPEKYFKVLFDSQKEKLTPVNARVFRSDKGEYIRWSFRMPFNNLNLRFVEYVFPANGRVFRLGFWTISALYDDYVALFDEIAATTCIFPSGEDAAGCTALLTAAETESEIIEYATDKRELYFNKEAGICKGRDKSYIWKVSSPTNEVYLFGSIHFAKPEMYPLKPRIEKAFDESDVLVLELNSDTDEFKKKAKEMFASAQYPEGESLKDHISEAVYTRLEEYLNRVGIPVSGFMKLKPWAATIMLETIQYQLLGFSPEYGMEQYFLNKIRQGTSIVELETFEEQMDLFLKYLDNETYLNYSLLNIDSAEKNLSKLFRAWDCGNTKVLSELFFDEVTMLNPDVSVVLEKMFYERNRRMSKKILSFLKDERDYFVIIGAGHLTGDKSILTYLEEAGYTAEQL
jgi:uncharacterized protein YbaP (TraB family)